MDKIQLAGLCTCAGLDLSDQILRHAFRNEATESMKGP